MYIKEVAAMHFGWAPDGSEVVLHAVAEERLMFFLCRYSVSPKTCEAEPRACDKNNPIGRQRGGYPAGSTSCGSAKVGVP